MNRHTRVALFMMTLLIGIAWLSSCARTEPPAPSPSVEQNPQAVEEATEVSPQQDLPSVEQESLAVEEARDEARVRIARLQEAPVASSQRRSFQGGALQGQGAGDQVFLSQQRPTLDLHADIQSSDTEFWVIAKAPSAAGLTRDAGPAPSVDEGALDPGSGALVANISSEDEDDGRGQLPLPLQHTAVDAAIAGHISTVRVKQQFTNPFDTKIEAVYVFPLPEQAAVTEFLMVIGERTIRGILREKAEAEAIYRAARDQGYRASLLVQHRPNIFEQKVANIEPGKAIDVDITYFHTLAYKDGWYSFVFPTVVGPRFNPPGYPDPIHARPRGGRPETPGGTAPGGTTVEYLAPMERSGHDLGIRVRIDAGVRIEGLNSTHEINVERDGPETATVQLADRTTIPNRDFVLDFRVAGDAVKSNLMTYQDPETGKGFFSLMVVPPVDTSSLVRRPMEMVFVLDCSGSMSGQPLWQAKQAVATALGLLRPDDTFQIIRFSDNSSQFGQAPVPATEANLAAAHRYLDNLNSMGGTMMIEGIRSALDFPHDPARLRFVTFMTDGFIGNEADILGEIHQRMGNARIFSFGVGSSVNRYLMDRMAKVGRGAAAYLGLQDSAPEVMDAFFARVSHAALTDVSVDWGGMTVSDTYPARLPDLFVGRPLVVTGRFRGEPASVTVSGTVDDSRHSFVIEAAEAGSAGLSIPKVWARANIADLSDRQATTGDLNGELSDTIRRIALRHQLVSNYTSFVAVDSSELTEGEYGVTVRQAVPVPEGVRYETTVVTDQNTPR